MTDNVMSEVLRRCREALLSEVPIIYVKTDSDVFIRKLITNEEMPLVVLLSSGGKQGPRQEYDLKRTRPIYELPNRQDKHLSFCLNYENAIPACDANERYHKLEIDPKNGVNEKMSVPFLWTCKMPDAPEKLKEIFPRLERYVVHHEDPEHPQYEVLRKSAVILYSSNVSITPMLRTYTEFIDVRYPEEEEIRDLIKTESAGDPHLTENEEYLSVLCSDFLGFTTEEIIQTMHKIRSVSSLARSEEVESIISDRKRQKMEGGILEQCSLDGEIGGMDRFRIWLKAQEDPLTKAYSYQRKTGTPPPKGVLLCGIPGCGKSEAAKFTAKTLRLPLLKMDMGSLMDKYQGVSEQKMRDALQMAQAMSPCVLWIDELEKGFSGAGKDGDTASFQRMFGYMLGWMQDNDKPCFIFATANDIGHLPKEFFRSGRFDALYAVYLPTAMECVSIFKACMDKAVKNSARARRVEKEEISLFQRGCFADDIYKRIMNEELVTIDGRPRIVIGSDIQKIVNLALRELKEETPISGSLWEATLKGVIQSSTFCAYGDGEENVDSIAIGYCRMLRKQFIPTASHVLFRQEDYRIGNAEEYGRLKKMSLSTMKEEELAKHREHLSRCEVLQDNGIVFENPYDRAVYSYLRPRINEMALLVERHEREAMVRR